jgi:tetratricopeptide (TPR) repeat protein
MSLVSLNLSINHYMYIYIYMMYMCVSANLSMSISLVGDFISAFESYIGLAEYFESNQDTESMIYYFEKALEAARKSSDVEVESNALEIVGSAYERIGLEERAIGFHENQLRLSKANHYTEGEVKARENLISVYMKFAGACVDRKNYLDAAHYLGRASDVAETSGELERRARIQHRLSQVYFLAGEFANAQRIEETCLQTCDENGWKDLQEEVLVGLARILEQNEDFVGAIDTLEEVCFCCCVFLLYHICVPL